MTDQNDKNKAWKNPWFLGWMGLLVFVFIVNFSMVFMAITNKPRLLTDDFYKKGKAYSDNRLKLEANKLPWQAKVELPDDISFSQASTFKYHIIDEKSLQPVSPAEVIFYAYRPSDGHYDFSQKMTEIATGQYTTTIKFPLKGIWDIIISAQQDGKEHNTAFNIIARDLDN